MFMHKLSSGAEVVLCRVSGAPVCNYVQCVQKLSGGEKLPGVGAEDVWWYRKYLMLLQKVSDGGAEVV